MTRRADLLRRLTGISTPIGGVSWEPSPSDDETARRVLALLQDRRVLFEDYAWEMPDECVKSVLRIREALTQEVGGLPVDSPLAGNLRAILAASRKFMRAMSPAGRIRLDVSWGYQRWRLESALGELRGVVGIHVAIICQRHGLEPGRDLARILPEPADDPESREK